MLRRGHGNWKQVASNSFAVNQQVLNGEAEGISGKQQQGSHIYGEANASSFLSLWIIIGIFFLF